MTNSILLILLKLDRPIQPQSEDFTPPLDRFLID